MDPVLDAFVAAWRALRRGLSALVLVSRALREALAETRRSLRGRLAAWSVTGGEGPGLLPMAPALRHVAVAAVAAVGLVWPGPVALPPVERAPITPSTQAAMPLPSRGSHPRAAEASATEAARPTVPVEEHSAVTTTGGSQVLATPGGAGSPKPAPRATITPPRSDQVVREHQHEAGTSYRFTPRAALALDPDGDGNDDVSVPVPEAGWDCAPPGERGPASAKACPAFEDLGVLPSSEDAG